MRALALALLVVGALARAAAAQERPPVVVTDPTAQTYKVAVQRFAPTGAARDPSSAMALRDQISEALDFSGVFTSISPRAFLGPVETRELHAQRPMCGDWTQIGADALVEGEIELQAEGRIAVEFRGTDLNRCRPFRGKIYRGKTADLPRIAKRVADDVVEMFTGQRGVSSTEIAFVSDRTGAKEIHVMDADGARLRRATGNRSINTFPSWSPNGASILYTSYRQNRRPGLFVLTRGGGGPAGRILAKLNGGAPQYRGVFDPSGDRLALVMSASGASEIFTVGLKGQALRRLTRNRAIDVGPTWSPDGRRIAFVSDRGGAPQIYVMDQDGSQVRRLTYDGSYNTDPEWSPDGRWIAYQTRAGGSFDIWLIDPDGSVNVPLVTHPRSDEHPTWSPDGRKLAFQSNRRGRYDVYSIDIGGRNLRRLTEKGGNNTSPAWGPYPGK